MPFGICQHMPTTFNANKLYYDPSMLTHNFNHQQIVKYYEYCELATVNSDGQIDTKVTVWVLLDVCQLVTKWDLPPWRSSHILCSSKYSSLEAMQDRSLSGYRSIWWANSAKML